MMEMMHRIVTFKNCNEGGRENGFMKIMLIKLIDLLYLAQALPADQHIRMKYGWKIFTKWIWVFSHGGNLYAKARL